MTTATPQMPPPSGFDAFLPNLKTLAWVGGFISFGFAAYYGAIVRIERVTDKADAAVESAKHAILAANESREAADRALREYRAAADARISALESSSVSTIRRVDVIEERMSAIGKTADQIYARQEVLLDRLNPPRQRVVRDFPP